MTEREKIEILQKKAEIPEAVRQMVFQSQEQGYDDETTEAYTVKYATDQIVEAEQINSLLYVKPGGNLQEPWEEDLVEVKLPK